MHKVAVIYYDGNDTLVVCACLPNISDLTGADLGVKDCDGGDQVQINAVIMLDNDCTGVHVTFDNSNAAIVFPATGRCSAFEGDWVFVAMPEGEG